MARRAISTGVRRWIEALEKQNLFLQGKVTIIGPHVNPFDLESFGDDMYLAKGEFTSSKPRRVPEETIHAVRALDKDLTAKAQQEWGPDERSSLRPMGKQKALPEDAEQQLDFVTENADQVYQDQKDARRRDPTPPPNPWKGRR